MFGSIALDVVISLVLIYLLYSLLVTIVGEIISSRIQIRAKMLKSTIASMLLDNSEIVETSNLKKVWLWISSRWNDYTYIQRSDYENSLAERFYNYPSIKYLAKSELKKLPAYISKENFSETIFNILREKGAGIDDMAKINFCLKYNTLNIGDETKKHITNLFQTANSSPDAFKISLQKWFEDTMDRLNGAFKKRIRPILFWIGFIIAVGFNVDSITIARMLSKDKEARNQLVQMGTALAKDSSRYPDFVVVQGDTLHSQAVIDSGYARVSKDINDANMILGLGWGLSELKKQDSLTLNYKYNKSSILKIHKLKLSILDPLQKGSVSLNQKIRQLNDSINSNSKQKYKSEIALSDAMFKLILGNKDTVALNKTIDINNKKIDLYAKRIASQTAYTRIYIDSISKLNTYKIAAYQKIDSIAGDKFASIDSIHSTKDACTIIGTRNYYPREKAGYFIRNIFSSWSRLLGFILTALALSLGAPFWFDLLNKLVSIRGAGVKPEEKKEVQNSETNVAQIPLAAINPNAPVFISSLTDAEQLLALFTEKLKNTPGVIGIGLESFNNNLNGLIVVHVSNPALKTTLANDYGLSQILPNGFTLPVKYFSHLPNITQAAELGGEISNGTLYNGHGTLSCFLKKTGSAKTYLLSCWHVLKDNDKWETAPVTKDIIDTKNKKIGTIVDGCLTDSIDFGIAECIDSSITNNTGIQFIPQFRKITAYDSLVNTNIMLYGKVCGLQKAQIFHHQINASLKYSHQDRFMYDLFSISIIDRVNGTFTSPTKPGDSGAIIVDSNTQTLLGIIIGGNKEFSYGIKFSNAFSPDSLYKEYSFKI